MKKLILLLPALFADMQIFAQDFAVKQLENSPRHHEWVKVEYEGRIVHCFIAYPEISEKATVAIVIHENRGLTDWVRSFSDQLAAAGYIAIAPDMLSGFSAQKTKTSDFSNADDARNAIYQLDAAQIAKDLNAVQEYARKINAGNGKTVAIGFCWGGGQSFRLASYNEKINAALVFYGSAPEEKATIDKIKAPVYGFYGGNDERINAGIPSIEKMMREAGKLYNYKIYEGAGHAYMRLGEDPEASIENKKARDESWNRIKEILSEI